ncbi:hypothetical protein [Myroides fluvii]|uniref:hypothetical protein n=1 Tax=Myroides fluvii TaxID=2572594 RepID=UPI001E509EE5|nr:hypothetical protein [Myroides fluvii]
MFTPELLNIISYKLHKLNIDSVSDINESEDFYFTVDNKIDLGFNDEHFLIQAILDIEIKKILDKNEDVVAKSLISIEYVFHVENFGELHTFDDKGIISVDKNLTTNIAAVAYSTTRGLLLDRFRDTAFDNFILPIVDINKDIITNAQS